MRTIDGLRQLRAATASRPANKMCNKLPINKPSTRRRKQSGYLTRVIHYFLAFFTSGGPLRFFDVDASFAARCACLKRSILTLL